MTIASCSQPRKRALSRIVLALATLATGACLNTAHATYPGENGVIVFDISGTLGPVGSISKVSPGSSPVVLAVGGINPVVSPNGKKVAFLRLNLMTYEGYDIYVVNIDGSNEVKLTDASVKGVSFVDPMWSPDGSKLGYILETDAHPQPAL